jgi:acetyltransferase
LRFFSTRRELPRSELARLTQIDYAARDGVHRGANAARTAAAQTLGVVRAVTDPDNVDAEFAIIVRSDLKGEGLGHRLLAKMIAYLRRPRHAAPGRLRAARERSMRELAASHGLRVDPARSDSDALCYTLDLTSPAVPRRLRPRDTTAA